MKKLLTILGLASILTLGVGGATYLTAKAQETAPIAQTETWDTTETFDSISSIEDNFDFYFCSSQNARRGDEFAYSWELKDGAAYRTGNVDIASDTVNIAIMTYVGEVYDNFELSVDFKAGSLTPYWPVIGIRQQIPGKNYTVEGGGAGVFMQQNGKITLWGPIVSGNTLGNLFEDAIPNKESYYALMWHTMRIRAEGSSVKVFVDEVQVASVTVNSTDYSKGYVSLISVNNDCAFDNFKVRALGATAQSGNEENRYEHADLGQGLDDIIENGYVGEQLPKPDASTTVGVPTVFPLAQQIIPSENAEDIQYTIAYNNGEFVSLKLNGLEVSEDAYTRMAATLILKKEYAVLLPAGDNVFTVTTTGGTAEFTLTVQRETVAFTDSMRIKKFSTVDVSFKMDFGMGALDKVTFGGAILPEDAYVYQNGALRIKREFLAELDTGVYEVLVYDKVGTFADCVVTIGVETSEVFFLNNDSFVVETNGYAQDLTAEDKVGLYGNGGGIASGGAGTLLIFDEDNIPYPFMNGKTYSITTYFKFENTVAGTSGVLDLLMPIYFKTSAGNADIGYLRYNDENGYYFYPEGNCLSYEFTEAGEWYRLSFSFTYQSSWTRMEIPVWMVTEFTMDNFVLAPVAPSAAVRLPEKISLPKNTQEDIVIDCVSKVIGINYGDKALTSKDYAYANGQITLKKEYLSALSAGTHTLTIYGTNSYQDVQLIINLYAFSISGDTAYTYGGGDMTLTVQTDGFELSTAAISDGNKTLKVGEDYSVEGNVLTLKDNYLQTVVGSETLTITFAADATLEFTVTSNKIFAEDFEKGSLTMGFAYNMTQELTDGKSGKGMRLTNTSAATMLSLGGAFYDIEFEVGKAYTFSFDLKIENIQTDANFVISGNSCWIPITFGSGKDVTYLRVVKSGNRYTISNETQQLGTFATVGEVDENGFVTISFTFVPQAGCTNLTFDVWMPSTIVIDNMVMLVG